MSIYATWLSMGSDEHTDDCAIWIEVSDRVFERGPDAQCDCGRPMAPYGYRGSHVLPAVDDPRVGGLDVAGIPAFITRDGRDDGVPGLKDWLRLSVWGDAVVLTREQVTVLRDTLTAWLEREEES